MGSENKHLPLKSVSLEHVMKPFPMHLPLSTNGENGATVHHESRRSQKNPEHHLKAPRPQISQETSGQSQDLWNNIPTGGAVIDPSGRYHSSTSGIKTTRHLIKGTTVRIGDGNVWLMEPWILLSARKGWGSWPQVQAYLGCTAGSEKIDLELTSQSMHLNSIEKLRCDLIQAVHLENPPTALSGHSCPTVVWKGHCQVSQMPPKLLPPRWAQPVIRLRRSLFSSFISRLYVFTFRHTT